MFIGKFSKNLLAASAAGSALLLFLLGFYDFFRAQNENECEMTWMYQFPHFVKIPMSKSVIDSYPMYGLYIYAEGEAVAAARQQVYSGIPVLFLPGNSGSYKQVRSFASVALYKALDKQSHFYFDFFTIDFNEEISGLYGYILNRQLEYSRLALEHIMSLYEDHHYVVIIGHSMGGMLARTINVKDIHSHLVFTLATPHAHPVAITDPEFDVFYYHSLLNRTKLQEDDVKLTTISISGGQKDLLVSDKLGMSTTHYLQTSVPSIPGAWVSTDHLCILWCKQFVLVIVRVLFDLVEASNAGKQRSDYGYKRITTDEKRIQSTLNYHLVKRPSGKSIHTAFPKDGLQKPPKALWMQINESKFCQGELTKNGYIMFPIRSLLEKVNGSSASHKVVVMTSNTKPKSWIFGCTAFTQHNNHPYCTEVSNFSPLGEILPNRRKVIHLELDDIRKFSHLIVKTAPKDSGYCIHWDVYKEDSQRTSLPETFNGGSVFKNYSLSNYEPRFLAWKIQAELANSSACFNNGRALVTILHEDGFHSHGFLHNDSFTIRFINWSSPNPHLLVYADPDCEYAINVRIAYLETAGNIFRNYITLVPAYFASIILLSIYFQIVPEDWSGLHIVLLKNAFNLTLVPGVIVSVFLQIVPTDYSKVMTKAEVPFYLPIVCYFIAFALVFVITTGGWYVLMASGNGLHAIFTRIITKKLGKVPEKVTDYALEITFARIPITIAVLMASLTSVTCGGFGICAGLFIYFIKIFKMYEDCIEDLLRGKIFSFADGLSPMNFHHTIASLWFVIAALNLPSLIHWTRNFSYSSSPQVDISLYISLMLTPVVAILWQGFVPKYNENVWVLQRYLSYMTGIFIVLWGTHRLYIISFFVTLQLITLSFTQLFSSLLSIAERNARIPESGPSELDTGGTVDIAPPDNTVPSTSSVASNTNDEPEADQALTSDKKKD